VSVVMLSLSIIIPTFNEAAVIERTLRAAIEMY
jgi:glycosyltransferase involved in cell wall biosynthesis